MKKVTKLCLLVGISFLFTGNVFAGKIKKHRDQLRLNGYNNVWYEEVNMVDNNGQVVHIQTHVYCKQPGQMKCRVSSIANPYPEFELDIYDAEYTPAEKTVAENVLINGDNQIEGGSASGNISQTVQFVNNETGQSYYRTFSYIWITNSDGSIDSIFDVTNPF